MIKSIPTTYSVYDTTSNPIFGDLITYVKLEDEAGGGFIILEQPTSDEENLRFEIEELREILRVSEKMVNEYNNSNKEGCNES